MKSKYLLGIAIVIALVIVGYIFISTNREVQAPTVENSQTQIEQSTEDGSPAETSTISQEPGEPDETSHPSTGTFSDENNVMGTVEVQVFEVGYDGKSFSPSSADIRVGDVVFFKNNSSTSFWPASAPHPIHNLYPEFNSKAAIKSGETFEFKFTRAGEWKYHDHMNPGVSGIIKVSK